MHRTSTFAPAGRALSAVSVVGVVIATATYRLLTLRDLSNDHYMHLAWAQQVLMGELPGRDFVDPGMPLTYLLSAVIQRIQPGPFSEAVLCAVMLGIAGALVSVVVRRLTHSWIAALFAAAACVALMPRLYSYPKLLVPAVVLWLVQRYTDRKSALVLICAGAWIVSSALLRHDLGIYAALATLAGVVAVEWPQPGRVIHAVSTVALAAMAAGLPYAGYVWWTEGLAEHLRVAMEFAGGEAHQLRYDWPTFPALTSASVLTAWGRADATAALYYMCMLLPAAGVAVLATGARRLIALPSVALAAFVLLAAYSLVILRDPLDQRIPDLAVPLTVSLVVLVVAAGRASVPSLRISAAVMALAATACVASIGRLGEEFRESQIAEGPRQAGQRLAATADSGGAWPWTRFWPNSGGLPATVPYLNACTGPSDFIMLTWSAPEYYFFARRRFGGGHALLMPSAFANARDDAAIVLRLLRQRPVLVLINETERPAFRRAFPAAENHISEHYARVAAFSHYDGAEISVAARRDLRGLTTFGEEAWPCQFVEVGEGALAE